MKKVLYHTIYPENQWGHGGEKRTAQLKEILSGNNIECKYPDYHDKSSFISILKCALSLTLTVRLLTIKSIISFLKYFKNFATQISSLDIFLRQEETVFIWESTSDIYYYLPCWARKKNKVVIAIPHNLESLVPGKKSKLTGKTSPYGFNMEIKVLRQCDVVFAISREETLMLKLFGVNALHLPYYPPREVEEFLLSIREQRQSRFKNKNRQILLLGSVINPPTCIGIMNRIHFIQENNFNTIKFRIAGYGTDQVQFVIPYLNNIQFIGEISKEQLKEELLLTDALLIHQPASTGALTRIIEFLIAGIPIIANEESARNYQGMDGIYIYENDTRCIELINCDFKIPVIPTKPSYELFIDTILKRTD